MLEWKVSLDESGQKLLQFILGHLKHRYSANSIKKIINGKGCKINGRVETFASTLVGTGDRVTLWKEKPCFPSFAFEKDRILFEDKAILAYNKPAELIVMKRGFSRSCLPIRLVCI